MTSNENEFRLAIHNALCSCLGLPPSSEQALSLIRQAYTEPENNPQPARTADVIYWSLSPEAGDDPASYNETAASAGTHKPAVHRYLAYQLLIVCYGPGCEAYAHRIRSFLYLDGAGLRGRSCGRPGSTRSRIRLRLSCSTSRKAPSGVAARISQSRCVSKRP